MKKTLIAGTLTVGILASTAYGMHLGNSDGVVTTAIKSLPLAKEPTPIVLHEETVISALQSKARFVAPTGKVEKTVVHRDKTWLGEREYAMTVKGEFILGVDTKDIAISVEGNTIKVRIPQPKIVSLDLPYDRMTIAEDKSLLRKELPAQELKAMYSDAEKEVREDIAEDDVVQATAETQMERAVTGLLLKINGVEQVIFE